MRPIASAAPACITALHKYVLVDRDAHEPAAEGLLGAAR
jgi:hypothetical protein